MENDENLSNALNPFTDLGQMNPDLNIKCSLTLTANRKVILNHHSCY